jgi:hypothetical protein
MFVLNIKHMVWLFALGIMAMIPNAAGCGVGPQVTSTEGEYARPAIDFVQNR